LYQENWRIHQSGRFVPRCTKDGKFKPVQAHGGITFCVNENGIAIRGLEVYDQVDGMATCKDLGND